MIERKNIPLVNLDRQYEGIKNEIIPQITDVIESSAFIQGKYVLEFEEKFSRMHHVKNCIGCSSGTSALFLALKAAGVKAGDEVITTAQTFIATAEAICHVGATPVFVDILPQRYTLDPELVEAAISPKTRAIVPVHLYGQLCDMESIMNIAEKYSLKVVEDCAQAHLANIDDQYVGTLGHFGAFSFYPGKNLGAYGDAGCVITDDNHCAEYLRKLRDHGRESKYEHDIVGYNARIDGLNAAVLTVKMRHLHNWTEKRKENAQYYDKLLGEIGLDIPKRQAGTDHVYHLYVIEVDRRDDLVEYLRNKGVGCGVHYPIPLHLQKAFNYLDYCEKDFPVTEEAAKRIISLPMCPELKKTEAEYVVACVEQFFKS